MLSNSKFSIETRTFKNALSKASKFIISENIPTLLSNILIKIYLDNLLICASNTEYFFSMKIPAVVDAMGNQPIMIPFKTLYDTISLIEDENIDISLNMNFSITIISESSKTIINGIDGFQFPKEPDISGKTTIFNRKELELFVHNVSFASLPQSDISRPSLTGVFTKFEKINLTLVATDGFRIAIQKSNSIGEIDNTAIIIPAKPFMDAISVINDDEINITQSNNKIKVYGTDIAISLALIEGNFPDYHQIIPGSSEIVVKVNTKELITACKQSIVIARDDSGFFQMNFINDHAGSNSKIVLSAKSEYTGESNIDIPSLFEKGDSIQLKFNAKFIIDVLNRIQSDNVVFSINKFNTPVSIYPENNHDYLYVIMPVVQK